jgi:hypothetical protein
LGDDSLIGSAGGEEQRGAAVEEQLWGSSGEQQIAELS